MACALAGGSAAAEHTDKTGFEGAEKRLELDFFASAECPRGLRALTRAQLDEYLTQAQCMIVSERHAPAFDAYVLSESSLFVYSTKLVIKTCGTTALLVATPRLLELAAALGLAVRRCKYTRACFKYPKLQPFPHRSWPEETAYLDELFGKLGESPSVSVLGTPGRGLLWHTYTAEATEAPSPPSPTCVMDQPSSSDDDVSFSDAQDLVTGTFTLEVCMTELAPEACQAFFFGVKGETAEEVTVASGIRAMFPKARIDDFLFQPCGYSMNGLQGAGFMTIHVTPEDHCSYASVEISGHSMDAFDPAELVEAAARVFQPRKMSVALSGDAPSAVKAWAAAPPPPTGLTATSGNFSADLAGSGSVSYYAAAAAK